eukprot:3394091-Rhodomonas_salina.1
MQGNTQGTQYPGTEQRFGPGTPVSTNDRRYKMLYWGYPGTGTQTLCTGERLAAVRLWFSIAFYHLCHENV